MRRALVFSLCAVVAIGTSACGGKKEKERRAPPPEVTGLAAVPASAQVVIGIDVAKLASSPIVARATEQLLLREPSLAESWAHVNDACKIDVLKHVKHVVLALGPSPTAAGSGAVLAVATGTLSEPDLATCVRTLVGKGGGALTTKNVAGRSLYQVKDGNRVMHFGFGRPDTIVLGTDEAWVIEGLSANKKVLDNPEMAGWLRLVDQYGPVFAVGRVDERVATGLVTASGGKLAKPVKAFFLNLDPTKGAKLLFGVVMPDPEAAKQLESFADSELLVASVVAQIKSLGPIVQKLQTTLDGSLVRFTADLSMEEVNQLLSVLDETTPPEQVTPPAK
ncbi:MAG: hypothetical protein ACKV2T_26475 [Kofleriaceae bacterium]